MSGSSQTAASPDESSKFFSDQSCIDVIEISLPWPISDRDYVYHAKATNQGESVILSIKSMTHRKAPKTVGVRAHLHRCTYTLVPKDGNRTHVTVEVHTDPKGILPNWLVNLIQKKWPIKTLSGIRRQVTKSFVKPKARPPKTT